MLITVSVLLLILTVWYRTSSRNRTILNLMDFKGEAASQAAGTFRLGMPSGACSAVMSVVKSRLGSSVSLRIVTEDNEAETLDALQTGRLDAAVADLSQLSLALARGSRLNVYFPCFSEDVEYTAFGRSKLQGSQHQLMVFAGGTPAQFASLEFQAEKNVKNHGSLSRTAAPSAKQAIDMLASGRADLAFLPASMEAMVPGRISQGSIKQQNIYVLAAGSKLSGSKKKQLSDIADRWFSTVNELSGPRVSSLTLAAADNASPVKGELKRRLGSGELRLFTLEEAAAGMQNLGQEIDRLKDGWVISDAFDSIFAAANSRKTSECLHADLINELYAANRSRSVSETSIDSRTAEPVQTAAPFGSGTEVISSPEPALTPETEQNESSDNKTEPGPFSQAEPAPQSPAGTEEPSPEQSAKEEPALSASETARQNQRAINESNKETNTVSDKEVPVQPDSEAGMKHNSEQNRLPAPPPAPPPPSEFQH